MSIFEDYKRVVMSSEKLASNQELLDDVLELSWRSRLDPYDGFTIWEYHYLLAKLKDRLSNWLEEKTCRN